MLWQSLRNHSFPPPFTWLPLTTLDARNYVDHHLLFHFFQIPFTWSGNLRLGAKISATIFASLAVFSCYWLLIRYRIRYAFVWLLALLACSAPFLYRMNMAKAPPFAIIYLIVAIYLFFRKKYWPLLAAEFRFRTDLRHVCVADSRDAALDCGHWLDGKAAGMAAVGLGAGRHGGRADD